MRSPERQALAWRLGVLAMSLAALLHASLHSVSGEPSGAPAAADSIGLPAKSIKARLPAGSYAAVSLHPLFEPSRLAWSPPANAVPPLAAPVQSIQPPRGYTLVGLVMTSQRHAALLRDSGGKTRVLTDGQALDGWHVRAIDAAGIHLEADKRHVDLKMEKQGR